MGNQKKRGIAQSVEQKKQNNIQRRRQLNTNQYTGLTYSFLRPTFDNPVFTSGQLINKFHNSCER